ncbi:hypothetical protein HYO65_gp158 [Tenacibaculum phage PTm1]|uniref:Uncharacterized protein n=2 Tax=Shirahamavirus PTm1 TaxID=2846435 RepID=A0A5S9HXA4_9CAUD|nr:hypothetical protein HYO65_gp158 [Tenacibaculum phage PTm1]BBI90550.1 hypothetical protein [Tenacibaculum phage PTm1]BBI90858.1 hypothetical protein [Tenacibaculum phage PTm5]
MNNRIYPKFKATNELLDKLPNKYGELGHPNRNTIDLSKVTHIIKSVSKKKNKLPRKKKKAFIKKYGIYEYRLKFKPSIAYDIEFFDTKHGKLARELYNKKK